MFEWMAFTINENKTTHSYYLLLMKLQAPKKTKNLNIFYDPSERPITIHSYKLLLPHHHIISIQQNINADS